METKAGLEMISQCCSTRESSDSIHPCLYLIVKVDARFYVSVGLFLIMHVQDGYP